LPLCVCVFDANADYRVEILLKLTKVRINVIITLYLTLNLSILIKPRALLLRQ